MGTVKETIKATRPLVHLMVACALFLSAISAAWPFLVDVSVEAICPGRTACSQLILMMGGQQLVTGLGSVFLAPVLGSLSDEYGRKPIFMIIMFSSVVPAVVVAYSKTKVAIYVWFLFGTIATAIREASTVPNIIAYVTDLVDDSQRAAAVSMTMSSMAVGFFVGTMLSFTLKTPFQAYLFAAIVQVSAPMYLVLFVKESNPMRLLPTDQSESTTKLLPKSVCTLQTNQLRETAVFIWRSRRLRVIALVDFTAYLVGSGALQSFTLYFLKFTFNFGKDQYAALTVTGALCLVSAQMLIYPTLAALFGERGMLRIGLLCSFAHYILYGLAWSPWVTYLAAAMVSFASFISLSLGTMASRGVAHEQQGKVQGVLSGIKSTANIISAFVMTPLTEIWGIQNMQLRVLVLTTVSIFAASALGENPPLNIPGLPFFIAGGITVVVLLISLTIPALEAQEQEGIISSNDYIEAPTPPSQKPTILLC